MVAALLVVVFLFAQGPVTRVRLWDTDLSHSILLRWVENDNAGRNLDWLMTGGDRQITLLGNPTLDDWFDQDYHIIATPTFAGLYLESSSAAPFLKLTNESNTVRDPIIQFEVGATPVTKFTMGVDDSDVDDAFRLDKGATLGADLVLYSGNKNAIFGEGAFLNISIEDVENNVILGYRAAQGTGNSDIGDGNVIIGADAALYTESGSYDNVILGHEVIPYLCDSSYGNLIAGAYAGASATGALTRSVLLGYYANAENDRDNVIVLGANVSGGPSNTFTIGRRWDETNPPPVIIGSGMEPQYKLDLWHAGTAKSITSLVRIVNPITAADMDGTGTGLLFGLRAYEVGAGTYYDAAHIVAVAETDWSALDINSIDSYLGFYTSLNGVLAEKIRINSAGQLISNLAIGTAPLIVTSTTVVANLNADLLDGSHAAAFEPALGNPGTSGWVLSSTDGGVRSWIAPGGALALDDLTDVNASVPNAGDTIVWDVVTSKWIADAPGVGALALDDLSDVDAAAPDDEDVLSWDAGASAWVPVAPGAGSAPLGLGDLVDPNADRIFFWDDSAGASKWLACGDSVAITGTTLDTIQDLRTTAGPTFDHLHFGTGLLIRVAANINVGGGLPSRTTGDYDNAVGAEAQYVLTEGMYDNAFGYYAQRSLDTGTKNNAFGHSVQRWLTDGYSNNAFGYQTQDALTHGTKNNAFGEETQGALTTGSANNAFGHQAQYALLTGHDDNAFGLEAQKAVTTAQYCNAFGTNAQRLLTEAYYVNSFGANAGYSITTASGGLFLGNAAGYYETAANKLFIDNTARASEADGRAKALVYGIFAAATANQYLYLNANVAVSESLTVGGNTVLTTVTGEAALGNPGTNGWVLSSTTVGVRSWIPAGGALALDDLTDVNAPAPNDNDVLSWDTATSKWIPVVDTGAISFVDLDDVPANYAGAGGKVVKVNAGATGLEFVAGGAGVASFNDLDDVPASYVGQAGLFAKVKATEDGLEFAAGGGEGGAPTDAQYVTLAVNGTLSDERVLTAGTGIKLTDAGAGSTITAAADADVVHRQDWIHEHFDGLNTATIVGQGSYNEAGAWIDDGMAAGSTALVTVKAGADKMLTITNKAAAGATNSYISSMISSSTFLNGGGHLHVKAKINQNGSGYGGRFFTIMDGAGGVGSQPFAIYFRYSTTFQIAYWNGTGTKIMDCSKDTWYTIDAYWGPTGSVAGAVTIFIDGAWAYKAALGTMSTKWDRISISSYSPAGGSDCVMEVDDLIVTSLQPLNLSY